MVQHWNYKQIQDDSNENSVKMFDVIDFEKQRHQFVFSFDIDCENLLNGI